MKKKTYSVLLMVSMIAMLTALSSCRKWKIGPHVDAWPDSTQVIAKEESVGSRLKYPAYTDGIVDRRDDFVQYFIIDANTATTGIRWKIYGQDLRPIKFPQKKD